MAIDIDAMPYGDVMELKKALLAPDQVPDKTEKGSFDKGLCAHVGEKVLVRTYSAGVWFGTLADKCKDEIILTNARRLWRWHTKAGKCLASLSATGIIPEKCIISHPTKKVWMTAIELHSLPQDVIEQLENCPNAEKD